MPRRTLSIAVKLEGAAGSASGSARKGLFGGRIRAVQVKYHGQPATCDVVVKKVLAGVEKTLLTVEDNNTDLPLSVIGERPHGGGAHNIWPPVAAGELVVEVAEGNPADPGVVVVVLMRGP